MNLFEVGDRVRYVNRTFTSCTTAVDQIGTVVEVRGTYISVKFDNKCWNGSYNSGFIAGLWKWEHAIPVTQETLIIRKIKSLETKFKENRYSTKMKPLPFPKGA